MSDAQVASAREKRSADCDALRVLVHERMGRGEKVSVGAVKKAFKAMGKQGFSQQVLHGMDVTVMRKHDAIMPLADCVNRVGKTGMFQAKTTLHAVRQTQPEVRRIT